MHEFPKTKTLVSKRTRQIIKKIDDTGGTDRTNASGRPKLLNQKIGHQTALT